MTTLIYNTNFEDLVASATLEQLVSLKDEAVTKRDELWTPGHINSYLRNRYEVNDAYTVLITRLEAEIDRRLASIGNDI